jgi:hypothetical protein
MQILLAAIVALLAALIVGFVRISTVIAVLTGTMLVFATLALWYCGRIIRAARNV